MKITLVARNIDNHVVASAAIGSDKLGKEQIRIFLDMAEQGEIVAERVPPQLSGESTQQADFHLHPSQLIRFFEFCGAQEVPPSLDSIDMIKDHARTANLQWRVQINH